MYDRQSSRLAGFPTGPAKAALSCRRFPFPLFLSNRGLYTSCRLQRYAFPVLLALLWGVPALFQIDPIGAYFRHTVDPLFNLLVPR
jgi:hypothetical protein